MNKKTLALTSLPVVWFSLIFLPHYQQPGSLLCLLIGIVLVAGAYVASSAIFDINVPRISWRVYSFLALAVLLSIFLTLLGMNAPYLGFSRFGSYTMFLDTKITIFGDLLHLTSAANCKGDVRVGQILCDPWGRPLNQNSDVVRFFRFASITHVLPLGIISLCTWAVILYLLLRDMAPKSLIVWFMCLTPPMVLAIDRGNEIITISLIGFSIILFYRFRSRNFFVIPLIGASIFKLWPFILLVCLILFLGRVKIKQKLLILLGVSTYLLSHFSEFRLLAKYTQQGSNSGGSFGLYLILENGFYSLFVILLIIVTVFFLLVTIPRNLLSLASTDQEESWVLSFMITFIALFLTGPHFTYRLIILIPLSMFLMTIDGSKSLVVFIFITLLTSRLSVVVVLTAALSIVFMLLILERFVYILTRESRNV